MKKFPDDYRLRIRVIPRLLHFKQPAGTSRGMYTERQVWYVELTSPDCPQMWGLGECAPLHDLSCDYGPHYRERLENFCKEVERQRAIDHEAMRGVPSMLFGLETALLSAKASLEGTPMTLFNTPFTRGKAGIPINGLVWMGNHEEMLSRMEEKTAQGFRCVKLKIGAIDFEEELDLIKRLRSRFSPADVELRVDANGGFTPREAPERLMRLAQYGLHSIEQPIRAGQWDTLATLCRNTPLPIALDEELIGINDRTEKQHLLDTVRPQYLVLKPSLHGGLYGTEEWMSLADERSIPYWVTSALESNVGLNAIAQWVAATLPRRTKRTGIGTLPCQGLGTGQLFTDNFNGVRLSVEQGRLWAADAAQRHFTGELHRFEETWYSPDPTIPVHTSGSTGTPKLMTVEKRHMAASAAMTCRFLGLSAGDTALLCMPLGYIAGKMLAVRAWVNHMTIVPSAPSSHPMAHLCVPPTFAAMTPAQVYETLRVPAETALLCRTKQLIIGGGAISDSLEKQLRTLTPVCVWSTYGMTETLSHIAMRRINGTAPARAYTPLPGVHVCLNNEGCLVIDAPHIGVTGLVTNDLATLHADGTFEITGRYDNVICSGGIKLQAEDIERSLAGLPVPFVITAVPDEKYGEAVTLLYEGCSVTPDRLRQLCTEKLNRYEVPKHFVRVDRLPLTPTGKPTRAAARELAARAVNDPVSGTVRTD